MNAPASSSKTVKKRSGISKDAITASAEVAKLIVACGEMVPLVGTFVKGLGGVSLVLLTNLEQFGKNAEDVDELAKDIVDILMIARDAGINASTVRDDHEGLKDVEVLRKVCSEFEEFLSDLSTQVLDINRNAKGPWKNIRQFLASRNLKEEIAGHRQAMEVAKSKLLLSLSLSSNASIFQAKQGILSLQASQRDLHAVATNIQRDVSLIRAKTGVDVVHDKFRNLIYGDIQLRDICMQGDLAWTVDHPTLRMGEVVKFTADVSASSRVMVVKEYSGALGLEAWKDQLEIHNQAGRHPNLRQLYGIIQTGPTPSLVFYGKAGELPLKDFPKLFGKDIEFLAHAALTHAFHSAFQFSLTRLQVIFSFDDVRCTQDGLLLFDDLQVSPSWDRLYIENLAGLFRPALPEVQDSLNSFLRRQRGPVISKERLLLYYDVISVVASLHGNVHFPLERNAMFGKIYISDMQSERHFRVDCIDDEPLPLQISIIPEPEAETLVQISSGLWRYTLPEMFGTIELTCSISLTTEAKREHLLRWFSQGARILGQVSMLSKRPRAGPTVSQITQRYFTIHIQADWNHTPSSVPYLFFAVATSTQDKGARIPEVYLSSDPDGARLGPAQAPHNQYRCSVTDTGHDIAIYRPLSLECSTLFHKICGFHPLSLEVARYLNQPELALYGVQDDEVNMEISRNMLGFSLIPETAMAVPWEQVEEYSDMIADLDMDASDSLRFKHDPLREARIFEVNKDDQINPNIIKYAWLGGLTSGSWIRHRCNVFALVPQNGMPKLGVSTAVYILGGIGTTLVDSLLIRALLISGLLLYSWGATSPF